MEIKNKIASVFIICFIGFWIFQFKNTFSNREKRIKKHNISYGQTIECSHSSKNGGVQYLDYCFVLNNKKYKNSVAFELKYLTRYQCNEFFTNKTFPVVYYPDDPSNNMMIISPKDFGYYNIPFPDSLNWVKEYIKEE